MFKVANPPHPFLGFAKVKGLRISDLVSCHHMVGHSGWVGHGCPKNYSTDDILRLSEEESKWFRVTKKNVIYERVKFNMCHQEKEDSFVTASYTLAEHCAWISNAPRRDDDPGTGNRWIERLEEIRKAILVLPTGLAGQETAIIRQICPSMQYDQSLP